MKRHLLFYRTGYVLIDSVWFIDHIDPFLKGPPWCADSLSRIDLPKIFE